MLDEDIPEAARQVLELRAGAGRSSVAKLETMKVTACTDGRVRGMSLYHGAGTGRWTGRLIQPHNFPRGEVDNIESYIPFVLSRDYDVIDLMQPPIIVVMSMLRSMLTAGPGNELMVADFSAIEARALNWLARQDDMVALFQKYDAATPEDKPNFDPYRVNAARLYNIPLDQVQKFPHRHTGKFQELGCGFGMGAKKAVDAGKEIYQLEMTPEFAKEVVTSYRETHQHVVDYWYRCNAAAIEAVQKPGAAITVNGNVKFVKAGAYLYIILPSGRPLAYPAPRVVEAETPWGEMRDAVEFSGVHPITRQWTRMRLYGGLIVENIVQAVARDLLAEGKLRLEAAGYTPILSVHDEAISEVPVGFGTVAEFEAILSALPDWATGLPVAAEGWRGHRYRK
jgi:DNA polymerase